MTLPVAILAGGKATRLYPLTETIPKSLIEVAGKPFIVHQVELLRRNNVARVLICAGFLGEKIREVLCDGNQFGLQIDFVFDGPELLGTGGALKRALPVLGNAFFVLYGDSFLEINYTEVEDAFLRDGKLGVMTVYRNVDLWDRSNVLFRDGQIIVYDKKNPTLGMCHIDYGLGILCAAAFDNVPEGRFCDLADVYAQLVERKQLAGFEVRERFYEIGSPEGLAETRAYLARR